MCVCVCVCRHSQRKRQSIDKRQKSTKPSELESTSRMWVFISGFNEKGSHPERTIEFNSPVAPHYILFLGGEGKAVAPLDPPNPERHALVLPTRCADVDVYLGRLSLCAVHGTHHRLVLLNYRLEGAVALLCVALGAPGPAGVPSCAHEDEAAYPFSQLPVCEEENALDNDDALRRHCDRGARAGAVHLVVLGQSAFSCPPSARKGAPSAGCARATWGDRSWFRGAHSQGCSTCPCSRTLRKRYRCGRGRSPR